MTAEKTIIGMHEIKAARDRIVTEIEDDHDIDLPAGTIVNIDAELIRLLAIAGVEVSL